MILTLRFLQEIDIEIISINCFLQANTYEHIEVEDKYLTDNLI